jgi:two-component system response regulator CpxR
MRPKKVILLVDSEERRLATRRFFLETHGFRVLSATTGVEALELLRGFDFTREVPGTTPNLLLCDLLLTGMDGNELVVRVKREICRELPALLVSDTVSAFERAMAADGFLPKDGCSAAELLDRVRVLLVRRRGPRKRCAAVQVDVCPANREAA